MLAQTTYKLLQSGFCQFTVLSPPAEEESLCKSQQAWTVSRKITAAGSIAGISHKAGLVKLNPYFCQVVVSLAIIIPSSPNRALLSPFFGEGSGLKYTTEFQPLY